MKVSLFKSKMWSAIVLGGVCALNVTWSWAKCRPVYSSDVLKATVSINVPTSFVIPRDAPIGSEVYRTNVSTTNIPYWRCDNYDRGGYVSNWGTSDSGPSPLGTSGLGWKIFLNNREVLPNPKETYYSDGFYSFSEQNGSFRLYKMEASTSQVSAGNIGSFLLANENFLNFVLSNSITPVVSGCTTRSITVPLGKQYSNQFKGLGSTIGEKAFSIQLDNCPAGINSISYRLDPVNTALDAVNGILALDPGGATGVGIKITDGNNAAVGLGVSREFLKNVAEGSYAIPLKAAYYKTSDTVVGGAANASMQFTITYQ